MSTMALTALAPVFQMREGRAKASQVALTAQLIHAFTHALMQAVQDATTLNVATVHALLAPGDGKLNADLDRVTESWRFSWRVFEICSTTAAKVLNLAETQARTASDALWQSFENSVAGRAGFDSEQTDALRIALAELRALQTRYFEAAIEAHRRLIMLAAAPR